MENQNFRAVSVLEKQQKLKRILLSRAPGISEEQLQKIYAAIDFGQQYTIKVTRKVEKFKNIVTNELIETYEKRLKSESVPIYGCFGAGHFHNQNGMLSKQSVKINPMQAVAAIKKSVEYVDAKESVSYMLVVYCPDEKSILGEKERSERAQWTYNKSTRKPISLGIGMN